MHTHGRCSLLRLLCSIVVCVLCATGASSHASSGQGVRMVKFPAPPHPNAIGTHVGPIRTYVSSVTMSQPAKVHRNGLMFAEIRGTISGVGWGGMPITLACHYVYELPYVLRIPPVWDGGLVVFSQGASNLPVWEALESELGPMSIGRIFHEQVDRHVSDVALHPGRQWAFFAVNYVGVAPGGAHNTQYLGEPGCPEGQSTQGAVDVPIARNHALLARYLLKALRGREPDMTLAVGHGSGTVVNLLLNAGVDHRRPVGPMPAGDNHRTPYDASSGLIFDAFLSMQGGFAMGLVPAMHLGALSAPTLFVAGESDRGLMGTISQINQIVQMASAQDRNVQTLARVYSVRNLPPVDEDLVLSVNKNGLTEQNTEFQRGGGERLKPLTGALLDALAAWVTGGFPPPPSVFNGEVRTAPDRIEFHRTSPSTTTLPYVDDEDQDDYSQPPPVTTLGPTPAAVGLRTAWTNVRTALGAANGSIVLPETACRRGRFHFMGPGPIGTWFEPFDESLFLGRWGTQGAHQSCRVQTVDALAAAGLYDETVVTVDVRPDTFPNVLDLNAGGWLPVAILSTAGFDATQIAPGSLRIASATAGAAGTTTQSDTRVRAVDVNADGRTDLLVEFRMDGISLNPHDIIIDVWGRTRGGTIFTGSDVVEILR